MGSTSSPFGVECDELGDGCGVGASKELRIGVNVRQLKITYDTQPQRTNIVALLLAFEGRKIATVMAAANQVEKSAKRKIVVDETVSTPLFPHQAVKRDLHKHEQLFELDDNLIVHLHACTASATQKHSNGKKLLLHKSVSRWRPDMLTLWGWMARMQRHPALFLPRSGCIVTLMQPNSKRPARTFRNPELPDNGYPHNDGLTMAAITLLRDGVLPQNEYDEASHLCGHGRCVNPDHLVWEDMSNNARRNLCHHYGRKCACCPPCIPFYPEDRDHIAVALQWARTHKKLN